MVTEQLYFNEKFFVAASIVYGLATYYVTIYHYLYLLLCGYLLWTGPQNDAHCNCIKPL